MAKLARAVPLLILSIGCSDTIYNITEATIDASVKDSSGGETAAPTTDGSPSNDDASIDAGDAAFADTSSPFDGASEDARVDAPRQDAGADAVFVSLNGCTEGDFTDYSNAAASRVITFPNGSPFLPDGAIVNYAPPCMHIKAGESVTWVGDFGNNPLGANDNNPLNPIPALVDDGGPDAAFAVTFTIPGRYGYLCVSHGAMKGAIEVTP